ncbi:signal peptidase I [candidate division WOR-1 bacterium RIFOXYA12_FULL_43_27]|uniref:Signal peptidase I n=1 Tax=candidate division WOR-1 bacterium RIFOXYC2_FULL_46_14 TaxID=1802587 RepID=A0A1F4U6T7_UNCSA|nr:MAG: signal peptidase I [candidate division WOR-1 bacterium RIFOXYA12_FULL_43_27]OGC20655.1 MAG: signal peptidase I [candidate division WOR-1 bacterium RIFOXYB2_FULL_46_45]OGC31608.1 MAG: signal peptidase I [candidate division WOR-1 bacterium RIFOXYA2_FULL_46_56]OGC40013.1 MAG: signal peptidase I [candidate division WOR-1 bacterium RIFOXYC2_FULL_46_14]
MSNFKRWLWDWVETIVVALLLALIIRALVVQVFWIPSASMEPTLNIQDRIIVNKFIYRFKEPERFDVIVFRYPGSGPKKDFIKRVIGLPGEKLEIKNGRVFINGVPLTENHSMNSDFSYFGPVKIPAKAYLCLGDNRPRSADSRVWGFVPRKNIYGPAFLKIWPIWEVGIIR